MTRASGEGSLIAVVGMSCRLPRAADVTAYWGLLERGEDAISEVPDERWRLAGREPGEGLAEADPETRFGAFLGQVDGFDAAFFGLSPGEAAAMDPQQRLALELAWEALEDAGLAASALDGDPVGVFLGAIAGDYANLVERSGVDSGDPHTDTGLPRSIIASRVSRTLGLSGPSLTVDAGRAASLLAVHLACESLRRGESEIALAGGVHLNLDPQGAVAALRADGCVRGEGGGLVVLKPLAKACADGDRVYCVIRGSAVSNDGPGEALAAPNRKAQEKVLKRAYRRADLKRSEVQYVELDGSGEAIGDAVEAAALGAVFGSAGEAKGPLPVGSVKANLGHLEGAAGIAGLLKVALAIERRQIPASLDFEQASPEIPLDDLGLRVQAELSGWPDEGRPLVAGVSSFGPGGTNCHVVLTDVPAALKEKLNKDKKSLSKKDSRSGNDRTPPLQGWMPLPLSAKSEEALCAQADRLASHLEANPDLDLAEVGFSLATRRAHLSHRAVCLGGDREECLERLGALAKGRNVRGVVKGVARAEQPAVFVFAGQGSQWAGMGADLLESSPVFARHIDQCEQALEPFVDWSLGAVLRDRQAPWLDRIDVAQPAISMLSIALARLWQACGVEPSLVVGHSQGEIAAAHIAGALSLEDAALASAVYAQTCLPLVGKGGMAAVSLSEAAAVQRLEKFAGRLSLAAVNGTTSVVVSGDLGPLEDFLEECASEGLFAKKIALDYACHSAQIESLETEILAAFAPLCPRSAEIPLHSTVTAGPLDTKQLDAGYWYKNLRQVVRLEPVIRTLLEEAPRAFIEIGPHPALAFGMQETIDAVLGVDDDRATVLGSLRRGEGGLERFAISFARAHAAGVRLDWDSLFAGAEAKPVALPTYPFQRQRHWLGSTAAEAPAGDPGRERGKADHDLQSALAKELSTLPSDAQDRLVLELLVTEVAAVLDQDSSQQVDVDKTFEALGLESLDAVELRNRLRAVTEVSLPATCVFDYPTPAALAGFLREQALRQERRSQAPIVASAAFAEEPIAIVGMACRYPGGVGSPEQLWQVLAEGRDAIGPFPTDRGWNLSRLFSSDGENGGVSQQLLEAGFLDDAGDFDAEFFSISPREALATDPQQRLLLEICWEAIENAGLDPLSLRATASGVFVGIGSQDYAAGLRSSEEETAGFRITGSFQSIARARRSASTPPALPHWLRCTSPPAPCARASATSPSPGAPPSSARSACSPSSRASVASPPTGAARLSPRRPTAPASRRASAYWPSSASPTQNATVTRSWP